jgi:hypothetical protein
MLLFRIYHPHFLLVTVLLVGHLLADMLLIGTSVWHIACGPNKTWAAAWLLIGIAPFFLTAGHFLHGLRGGAPLTYANKVLIPLSESLMDLESRFRYPMRTVGAKVVMISPPVEDAAAQVAAMDEHVRQLEMRLGRQIEQRIYWVRGSLLGKQGVALVGLALGTSPQETAPDKQELDPLDRHEVAHCVVHMLCPLSSQPPCLLLEGWAEANSGHNDQWLADRVWMAREMGLVPALSTLTGYSETSSRSNTALYLEGGPLVNYLLQRFGSEEFLQLYTESRQTTFAADCQRILGMEVADLDTACWGYVEELVGENGPPGRRRLMQLTLGPAVDYAEWGEFLNEYFTVVPTWNAKFDSCEQVVEVKHHERNDDPKTNTKRVEYRLLRSGDRQALYIDSLSGHRVYVAVPQSSFTGTRASFNEPWTIQRATNTNQDAAYWSIWQTIRDGRNRSPAATSASGDSR